MKKLDRNKRKSAEKTSIASCHTILPSKSSATPLEGISKASRRMTEGFSKKYAHSISFSNLRHDFISFLTQTEWNHHTPSTSLGRVDKKR